MVLRNYPLEKLNSFGMKVKASAFLVLNSEYEASRLRERDEILNGRRLILGGGSNILFTEDYDGVIIKVAITGTEIVGRERDKIVVKVGAGVVWDDFVLWAVQNGYGGTENLSLIPGETGAAAVQNIGAYGAEVSNLIRRVDVCEIDTGRHEVIEQSDCRFSYRSSIFKEDIKGSHMVTSVTFALSLNHTTDCSYGSLSEYADRLGGRSIENVRNAVIQIRQSKLPDPLVTGNAGSFFKNPVVDDSLAHELLSEYPDMPVYDAGEGRKKIAAAWLIERCGWKGFRRGDAGVHKLQALVLVNHGTATGREILELSEDIRIDVASRFGINLSREVELI